MSELQALDDTTITKIEMTSDKKGIRFETDKGRRVYYTDGDCCSSSWVEHLSGLDALVGHRVVASEDLSVGEETGPDGHGCTKIYGVKLTTDSGVATLEYRNESNGYYGGNLEQIEPEPEGCHFYGGVYGQNNPKKGWTAVSEDF